MFMPSDDGFRRPAQCSTYIGDRWDGGGSTLKTCILGVALREQQLRTILSILSVDLWLCEAKLAMS